MYYSFRLRLLADLLSCGSVYCNCLTLSNFPSINNRLNCDYFLKRECITAFDDMCIWLSMYSRTNDLGMFIYSDLGKTYETKCVRVYLIKSIPHTKTKSNASWWNIDLLTLVRRLLQRK